MVTRTVRQSSPSRVAVLGALMACGAACSSSHTGAVPDAGQDANADTAAAPDSGRADATSADVASPPVDAGDPNACSPNAVFTPYPWAPPTPWSQGACTAAQITSYLSCFSFGDCAPFTSIAANAACAACIETDVSAKENGPVLTVGGGIQEVNFGGCQAHLDGDASPTSCGANFNDLNSCIVNECGDCDDITVMGPEFEACYKAAFAPGGPCTQYDESATCRAETSAGGVASVCTNIEGFLPLWCGQSVSDGGNEGGADAAEGG